MTQEQCTEKLLNAKALGQMLSLSKRQIFRLSSCGKLPMPIRIGGSVRWVESTIVQWLEAGAPDRKTFEAMQEVQQ
ncbi:MAG: helix-turn-helix transcriptional regulator [Planctomycetota bacterium]|jgi:predicted DNA-binding transcriptional regulator AlpA